MPDIRVQIPSASGKFPAMMLTGETSSTPAGGRIVALYVVLCGLDTDSGAMVPLGVDTDSAGYGILATTT